MAETPETMEWMKSLIADLLLSGKVANSQLNEMSKTLAVITVELGVIKKDTSEFQEMMRKALALETKVAYLEKEVEEMQAYTKDVKSAKFQFWGTVISAIIAFGAAVAAVVFR